MAARHMSMYSVSSENLGGPRTGGPMGASTLLNIVHSIYLQGQPYSLDAGTSLVVNTWLTATAHQQHHGSESSDPGGGPTVDAALAARAWEHARRRAEDGCIILGSTHTSTPSVLVPFLAKFPTPLPPSLIRSLEVLQPFLRCATGHNPSAPMYDALAVTLTLSLAGGGVVGARIGLSQSGIDTDRGLLNIPAEPGNRAFDVFYYLLTGVSTPAEREFLGLQSADRYVLLARSGTYTPPPYLPLADDAAAAEDWRNGLKGIGIKNTPHRELVSILAGILKLGDTLDYGLEGDALEQTIEDVAGLLGMEPEVLARQCSTQERVAFAAGLYEALVDWVIGKANAAIAAETTAGAAAGEGDTDTVCITVIEMPDPAIGRAVALGGVFDDSAGINAEMFQDGLDITPAPAPAAKDMREAREQAARALGGAIPRERQYELERREAVLERIAHAADPASFLRKLLFPTGSEAGVALGRHGRVDLASLLGGCRAWYHISLHPSDDPPAALATLPAVNSAWAAGPVSRQIRAWRLPDWATRRSRHLDFTADFDLDEFVGRYGALGCREGRDGIESWVLERGWSNGAVVVGNERVWMRESAWWEAEMILDAGAVGGFAAHAAHAGAAMSPGPLATGYSNASGFFPPTLSGHLHPQTPNSSSDHLIHQRTYSNGNQSHITLSHQHQQQLAASAAAAAAASTAGPQGGDYGLGHKGDTHRDQVFYNEDGEFTGAVDPDAEKGGAVGTKKLITQPVDASRRLWVGIVWALTFWIPSPLLKYVGRMRRPDVRMAWREKLVLCFLILLINAIMVFWIIAFGNLLCPGQDKVWSVTEVATHQGPNDFYVTIHGRVYDISNFWRVDHSDTNIPANQPAMLPLAGLDMDGYFIPPLDQACPGLGLTNRVQLLANNTVEFPTAMHTSGFYAQDPTSRLGSETWYYDVFTPKIREFYKGDLAWLPAFVQSDGRDNGHMWITYEGRIYDLTDYFHTQSLQKNVATYQFLDSGLEDIIQQNAGQDITPLVSTLVSNVKGNATAHAHVLNSLLCMKNAFYVGIPDFRVTARCQVNNYLLLAFTIILCAVIIIKFLAALQFGSKRRPAPQDKFVICQVPAYTEGEDSLRKAIDSLTGLAYDNKRKLICIICDGNIVGGGNDRPTPKIVLDILGVDPKLDPPALAFKSVGTGSEQLNYAKVYSGLYEYEGNVVPYMVVTKVGKASEQARSKPGNRGKRDSQILLMSFLNRVHHRAPMNPLELEMFHQINNIIGVDPELYEYLLMVDADTSVAEDSLTRLVAACANDAKISGICGETGLENDEKSWWTMIQVYEYFISHHLAKAFESLFGSVTCLPGCFSMYRLRTADRGKPLIISDAVIRDYSVCNVDTLHKKNLLSLGEDRYLTTLMTKHFPYMSNKFVPAAQCKTAAPESWSVLLSQRRRWINSTIHNLVELMRLREMCGFCCFGMRFVVFVDLFGTIILPATCVYLGWLVYRLATNQGQFPVISIAMLAGVYGLQALIFILKRQWQHIGWMIIYILAFPIYSFVLPIYSFWNQDNFSWGNTRIVVGEKGDKKVVAVDGEDFDPRSVPLQRWDDYALLNDIPGRRGPAGERAGAVPFSPAEDPFEKESEIVSVYSAGQGSYQRTPSAYGVPTPPPPPGYAMRNSRMSSNHPYGAGAGALDQQYRQSTASMGHHLDVMPGGSRHPSMLNLQHHNASSASLGLQQATTASHLNLNMNRSSAALSVMNRPGSAFDFQRGLAGPDDSAIADAIRQTMTEINMDNVTKKQLRALVEQRLQTELVGEKRAFMDRQIDRELENM